jgi:DNA-binding MarR family transcriptional regulator
MAKNQPKPDPAVIAAAMRQMAAAVATLRTNGFASLAEADVFCTAAVSEVAGVRMSLTDIVESTKLPFSTASRLAWDLHERGLFSYEEHASDRRRKLIRANIGALK